jgi:hypothetical protein
MEWVLVNPVAVRRPEEARRHSAGRDIRTLGFLCNGKPNAWEILQHMAGVAAKAFDLQTRFYSKRSAGMGLEPELLAHIATECDAVVTGSGD